MHAFILGPHQPTASLRLKQEGWHVIEITNDYAKQINAYLDGLQDAYFCVFPPATLSRNRIQPSAALLEQLDRIAAMLLSDRTGVLFELIHPSPPSYKPLLRIPLLWNREAVLRSGWTAGFADTGLLPFESYVLEDKYEQLSAFSPTRWTLLRQSGRRFSYADTSEASSPELIHAARGPASVYRHIQPLVKAAALPLQAPALPASTAPLFSIVMCCYNDAEYIPWALRSLLSQTELNWELLLLDDGSTPPLRASQLYPFAKDPRIQLIPGSGNKGKAVRLNQALILARGAWLVELDADDWLPSNSLELLRQQIALHPDASILYGDYELWTSPSRSRVQDLHYKGTVHAAHTLSDWPEFVVKGLPVAPRCYRTEALRHIGGWWTNDPLEGRFYEDIQMLARLIHDNPHSAAVHAGAPLYHRRYRVQSTSQRDKENYRSWREWLLFRLQRS